MRETQDTDQFWRDREIKTGGPILYRSFALFLGTDKQGKKDLSGLIYLSGEYFIFEDFEKQDPLSWLIKRKQKTYEKYEYSFSSKEIQKAKLISDSDSYRVIKGRMDPEKTRSLHPIFSLFSRRICQISLRNGETCFFEIMDLKKFLALVSRPGGV